MIRLNIPPHDIKLRNTDGQMQVLDPLRHRWVALTPEEWVRQNFIGWLIQGLDYPAALMGNEVRLSIGKKELRADSVLYDRQFRPRMIMEYKAPSVAITQHVFDQIAAYNVELQAEYLVVSNGMQHYCCKREISGKKYLFIDHIPHYEEI